MACVAMNDSPGLEPVDGGPLGLKCSVESRSGSFVGLSDEFDMEPDGSLLMVNDSGQSLDGITAVSQGKIP